MLKPLSAGLVSLPHPWVKAASHRAYFSYSPNMLIFIGDIINQQCCATHGTNPELLCWWRTPTTTNTKPASFQPLYHELEWYWGFRGVCCHIAHNEACALTAEVPEEALACWCDGMSLHWFFFTNFWKMLVIPQHFMILHQISESVLSLHTPVKRCPGIILHVNSLFTLRQAQTLPSIPAQSVVLWLTLHSGQTNNKHILAYMYIVLRGLQLTIWVNTYIWWLNFHFH